MVAVDVTKHNFSEVLPSVKEALHKCAFFAVDCEMTGLHTDTAKHEYLDDHQARYSKVAESSKAYIITQYGLSCFEKTGPNSYEASTFNFYVFPQPHGTYCRRFLCDASSLAFLSEHGFDFNTCIGQGVPFMPLRTRDWQLMQIDRTYEDREPAAASSAEDVAFVEDLVALVKDWLAGRSIQDSALHLHGSLLSADEGEEDAGALSADENAAAAAAAGGGGGTNGAQQPSEQLLLAPLNSFRRLLAFQELRKAQFGVEGHPGFWVSKSEDDSRCLVLVRATAQQAEAFEAQARAERIAHIHAAAGFAAVFEAMRASNKPCVGHNCMQDISYGLYSFADSYLPATWADYKKMVRSWHRGGVWDTKYIARRLPEVFAETSLSQVFAAASQPTQQQLAAMQPLLDAASAAAAGGGGGGAAVQLPTITHAPGFEKYQGLAPGQAAHEAGYDAFMTGATFAALLPLVAGKVATDPTHELAVAHTEVLQRAAEAAAAAQAAHVGTAGGAVSAAAANPVPKPTAQQQQQQQQQQRVLQEQGQLPAPAGANGNLQQQEQQKQPEQVPQPSPPQQPQAAPVGSALGPVCGVVGRLNLGFTDMPWAALWGPDPIPERPHTFHLTLQQGYRVDDVWRIMKRQGLGAPRITPVDSSSCLVTFRPEVAGAAAAAVADLGADLLLTPWQEYAAARYACKLPEEEQQAGADAAAMDVDGGGGGGGATRGGAAAVAAAAARSRAQGVKRPRVAMEAAEEEAPQQRSSCSIM